MARTYTYQTSATLTKISQNLIENVTLDDPIFKLFPLTLHNTWKLRWEIDNNDVGLMKLRGLGGEPTRITYVGSNIYEAEPGAYGEFWSIGEEELTTAAMYMNIAEPVDVSGLISRAQGRLTKRQYKRMRTIAWTLALTGTFSVPLPTGGIGHTDSYTPQTLTVSPLWSATTTATPLANLRDVQPVYGRGTSNWFGSGSEAWMNTKTLNYLLANTNASDLGGKRVEGGNTLNTIDGIRAIMVGQGAPTIMPYDEGYLDDAGTFQMYIPDGKVLLIAKRPDNEPPGEFMMTRNANNPGYAPGEYAKTMDYTSGPAEQIPPHIDVHQGFNGGPTMKRPGQLLVLTVA